MPGDKDVNRTVPVSDKPVELHSMMQTILTFMLLGVMSWVGLTLEKVKDNTAALTTKIAVSELAVTHNRELLNRHISNRLVHKK